MPSVAEAVAALARASVAPPEPESYRERVKRFLSSKEWRHARYLVLRRDGGRCQACGRSAADGEVMHVDHIVPLSRGGWERRLDIDGLQCLCGTCNFSKSNTDRIDWRPPRPALVVDNAAA
jgi:5-methylcytosine-specific restriction endonuclease McrA